MPFGYLPEYAFFNNLAADEASITNSTFIDLNVVGDVAVSGDVVATGDVTGDDVTASGAVSGTTLSTAGATIDGAGAVTATSLNTGSGSIVGGALGVTGAILTTGQSSAGRIQANNSYITAGGILSAGQGVADATFNGFFSQDVTNGAGASFADDGSLNPTSATISVLTGSATITGAASLAFNGAFGEWIVFTNITSDMTWRMTVDMGRTLPFFSHPLWSPYVVLRVAFGLSDYWRGISFETSPDNITWYQNAAWNDTDIQSNEKVPGVWNPGQQLPDPTNFAWRYCRWTFTDHAVGTANPNICWLANMGVRHTNESFWKHALLRAQLRHVGTTAGFFGVPPATRPTAYTVTAATPTKSLNPTTATAQDVGNTLAQVIQDLQSLGLLS